MSTCIGWWEHEATTRAGEGLGCPAHHCIKDLGVGDGGIGAH